MSSALAAYACKLVDAAALVRTVERTVHGAKRRQPQLARCGYQLVIFAWVCVWKQTSGGKPTLTLHPAQEGCPPLAACGGVGLIHVALITP